MANTRKLIKYTPQPFFLKNALFRFSQPEALNDPFEARPCFLVNSYSREDIDNAKERARRSGFAVRSEDEIKSYFLSAYPAHRMNEKSFPTLWPIREPRLRALPFQTLDEYDRAIAERAVELAIMRANSTVGIFSLSESEHETMWAHYANDHQGIAIEFDQKHKYFRGEFFRPVIYSDDPIFVTCNGGILRFGGHTIRKNDVLDGVIDLIPQEIFWRKQLPWNYEKEWRMIQSLSAASKVVQSHDGKSADIFLFEVPTEALTSITFGFRATDNFVSDTLREIEAEPKWHHLVLNRRRRLASGAISIEEIHL